MSGKVQIFGGGGTSASGITGSVQFSNSGAFSSDASNLFWDNTNKWLGVGLIGYPASAALHARSAGSTSSTFSLKTQNYNGTKILYFDDAGQLGINVLPTSTLHVKGANDSTGYAAQIQSQTYSKLLISNGETHAINGSVSAADNLKLTGDLGFTYSKADGTRYFKFNSATYYGIDFKSEVAAGSNGYPIATFRFSTGVPAFRFQAEQNTYGLYIGGGDFAYKDNSMGIEKDSYGGLVVRGFHLTTSEAPDTALGAVNLIAKGAFSGTNTKAMGINMFGIYSDTSFFSVYKALNLKNTFTISSGSNGAVMLNIDPTYNQTGGTATFTAFDYNPTLTSLLGSHYGLRIRSGLNGFGVGSTAPVAYVHIGAGTTAIPQMKFETSSAPTGGALTDGTFWFDGTNFKARVGGVTKTFTIV